MWAKRQTPMPSFSRLCLCLCDYQRHKWTFFARFVIRRTASNSFLLNPTRNLAIANRSRVSSAHEVTTVNFQGEIFARGEETYWTPVLATAASACINCTGGNSDGKRNNAVDLAEGDQVLEWRALSQRFFDKSIGEWRRRLPDWSTTRLSLQIRPLSLYQTCW